MLPILTPAESAVLDRASAERGIRAGRLMENAGRAVALAAIRLAGGVYGRRAVVVCGKGNNGGDGLVAARHLQRKGLGVSVVVLNDPAGYRRPASTNFRRFHAADGRWRRYSPEQLARELGRADVAVDAIFGTGFHGPARGAAAAAIRALNDAGAPVVAVDIPSGVEGETGAIRGEVVRADVTVTFGALKPGLVFHPGTAQAGRVEVADIGFPHDLLQSDLSLVERADVWQLIPRREAEGHKRSSGAVLVLAGSGAMTGAAILATTAAYRAGAGLVTLAVPQRILPVVEGAITEATFLPLPETDDGTVSERAWDDLLDRLHRVDAAAVGPGLSTNPSTAKLIRKLVAECPVPFVLDADGLNAFRGRGAELAARVSEAVITPHPGEFGRLTGMSSNEVVEDRVGHARKAAAEFRCTVLLKGSRTVVAEPDGRAFVNPTGGTYLATGGTGDVLTGIIAALLAQRLRPSEAAILGAYVHGMAGRAASEEFGDGTVASDVPARLPAAMRQLAPRAS
jgi:ADP-dependent NAD(P)H-hydrate dehydratase / NAD(P)H-hydrate epimerase